MTGFDFFCLGWAFGLISYPCIMIAWKIFENAVKAKYKKDRSDD